MNKTNIRLAKIADASDISELIFSTSVACCFTHEQPCPDWYKDSVQASQILNLIKSDEMVWLVAEHDNNLVGVLAISNRSHVKYFFVHPEYQNIGIGKQIWNFASRGGRLANSLTVRSSLFAVPIYERLGFKAVEPPKMFKGMCYQTMVANYS